MAEARQHVRSAPIFCHRCGERCGTEWVAEGFQWRNGTGDLYADERGNWHCSQPCLDVCGAEPFRTFRLWWILLAVAILLALDLLVIRGCAR